MEDHLIKYVVYNRIPKCRNNYEAMKLEKKQTEDKGITDKRLLLVSPELGRRNDGKNIIWVIITT